MDTLLDAVEGDLDIAGIWVAVNTTTRKSTGTDLRQLITYLAVDAGAGCQRWRNVAVFNIGRGEFHHLDFDALLLRISGRKPRIDALKDLVWFAQATELVNNSGF